MNFFREKSSEESKLYARIRDYYRYASVKSQIETFWEQYKPYAPTGFLKIIQLEDNFHQRWWEMYLGVGFLNLNFKIITSPNDKGPDYRMVLPKQTIWIEAVAPKSGKTDQALPDILEGVHDLPEKQFLLILIKLIKDKKEKFNRYINDNLITEKDCCIIALSGCALNQFSSLMDFPTPAPLKVLARAGNLVLSKSGSFVNFRRNIVGNNGNHVEEVNLFEYPGFNIISGILYSTIDPLNSPDRPEETFQLFLNPSNSPIKNNLLIDRFANIEIWSQIEKKHKKLFGKENNTLNR